MSENNEVEGSRLARQVEEIEKIIRAGGNSAGGHSLASLLEMKLSRLDVVRSGDNHIGEVKERKERENNAAIAHLVERENKLNEKEREQYASFLDAEYFRKQDLEKLQTFYTDGGAYDRLSDGGKIQMGQRIEEGIRRGELDRDGLPENIRRKHNQLISEHESLPQKISSGKSASIEADYLKEIKSGEKAEEEKSDKDASTQTLAFGDASVAINPFDLPSAGPNSGRSI